MTKKIEKLDKRAVLPPRPDVSHITVGRTTLLGALTRSQRFLRTYAGDKAVQGYLAAAGFDGEAYEEGWRLLRLAYGERERVPEAPPPPAGVLVVVERIEGETSSIFGRVRAVLHRFYPAQEAFVFDGLSAAVGFESVIALQTLLDRIEQLENGVRSAVQEQDQAAVQALDHRGVTPELRDELRKLCALVESAPKSVRPPPGRAHDRDPSEREARLLDLYAWVQDWSETARCMIPDKRILRRMGIGKRRARAAREAPVVVGPPALGSAPQPAPAPPPAANNGATSTTHA